MTLVLWADLPDELYAVGDFKGNDEKANCNEIKRGREMCQNGISVCGR